ncbi:MAG: T9SS type A sorting domain-containing protein [Bacteroides sp.]|jgi:hypothetical protein|nr:T9SS type A sorting domain-containing protein [Bacteroides sp.]
MKKKHFEVFLIALSIMVAILGVPKESFSQSIKRQSISAMGSSTLTDGILVSQTAGQAFNTTGISDNKVAILPGFQQPNTLSIEALTELSLGALDLKVFPNPASYSFTLQSREELEESIIQVWDMEGRPILVERVQNLQTFRMDCESWVNGIYFITVSDQSQRSSTFKLVISK